MRYFGSCCPLLTTTKGIVFTPLTLFLLYSPEVIQSALIAVMMRSVRAW